MFISLHVCIVCITAVCQLGDVINEKDDEDDDEYFFHFKIVSHHWHETF